MYHKTEKAIADLRFRIGDLMEWGFRLRIWDFGLEIYWNLEFGRGKDMYEIGNYLNAEGGLTAHSA